MFRQTTCMAGQKAARITLSVLLLVALGATACAEAPTEPDNMAEIEALIDTLQNDDDANERRWAAAALGQYRDPVAVPALLEALREEDDGKVRTQAATALGMIGDPEAVDDLIHALETGDEEMRTQATRALGEIGDERALGALSHALRTDGLPHVRQLAAWALGQTGNAAAIEPLAQALGTDGASLVRRSAAAALGTLGIESGVEPLITAIQDTDALVRWESVKALSDVGELAVGPLTEAIGQVNELGAWYAAFALEKIGTADAVQQVDQFLTHHGIDLEQVRHDYRGDWRYEVMVLALERHGTNEMARYFRAKDVDDFDQSAHWVIVHEAASTWLQTYG